MKVDVVDIIAILVLIGAFVLKLKGYNGVLDTTIAAIVGFYFGYGARRRRRV
jgi:hypothetical protein